ncbi:zinc transporter ZntB [Poseidonibacter ostreae]|nr:zinc transporter ZntB [Poseidonibacter ostreae]
MKFEHALVFDKMGGAKHIEVEKYKEEMGLLWLHLDYSKNDSIQWLNNKSNIDPLAIEALLTEETRPRTIILDDSILLALRGVNLNPNSDPEDMISIRLFINEKIIISTKKRDLLSVKDIVDSLKVNKGPKSSAEFIVSLTNNLTSRMENTISEMEERSSNLEESVLDSHNFEKRTEISTIRKEAISLRRYLSPQKDAISRLYHESISWIDEYKKNQLREINDQVIRYIEELDSIKDRVTLTQEELSNKLNEQMNLRMYVLSVISAIFLPIGFLTGLLGINIGGIPGSENKDAFVIFTVFLVIIVSIQLYVFRKKKWI